MGLNKIWQVLGFGEDEYYEEEMEENKVSEIAPKTTRPNLVALKNDNVKVMVIEPKTFEEAPIISDNLKENKPVIINLEGADAVLIRRIVDFVGGTCYSIGGSMQKIGYKIILVVPKNVDISGDFKDEYLQQDQEEVFSWVSQFEKGDE